MDEPNNLRQAMEAAQKPQAAPPASSDPERLLIAADRLLRAQQARMVDAQAAYEQRRTDRSNYYRGEMQRLADEAENELLTIDIEWHAARVQIASLITKLKALRSA